MIVCEQDNCRKDTNEVDYYRSYLPIVDTGMDTYIKVFCLVFLALSKIYKASLKLKVRDQLQAAFACLFMALLYIIIVVPHSLDVFSSVNIQDMIAIVFILTYNDSIRRASGRMIKIAIESIEVLIVFASVLLAFACMARILFFGTNCIKFRF